MTSGGASHAGGSTATAGGRMNRGGASSLGGAQGAGGSVGSGGDDCGLGGSVPYERRLCDTNADCLLVVVTKCCGPDRVIGIAREPSCAPPTEDCSLVDCVDSPGFVTDDNQISLDPSEIFANCQVGEPGAGLCRSTVDLGTGDSFACGDVSCSITDICVHRKGSGQTPECKSVPPGCGAPLACACVSSETCGSSESACQSVEGRNVYCLNLP